MHRTAWRVTIPPATEPVALADLKTELGITDTSQDARLTRMITAARAAAETFTNRALNTQTIRLTLDTFPNQHTAEPWWHGTRQAARASLTDATATPVYLPRPPLFEVLGVAIVTPDGAPDVIDLTTLLIDDAAEPARIMTLDAWPATREALGVTITYRAGYGPTGSDVPPAIREAILAQAIAAYLNPTGVHAETIDNASTTYGGPAGTEERFRTGAGLTPTARALLEPYRVRDLGALTSPLA